MLKSLNIRGFAVIDEMQVDFRRGLNVLTGETGSGKSIIVDAMGLLLGGRSSAVQVRTGETQATLEAVFDVSDAVKGLLQLLDELGVERRRELTVRRDIYSTGKGRIWVNEKGVSAGFLKKLQPLLADIYGQGEQRSLLSTQSHRELLDHLAGCLPLRQNIKDVFARLRSAEGELRELSGDRESQTRSVELIQHQLTELERLGPRRGEDEELLAERNILVHAERILELASKSYDELYESDDSVLGRLTSVRRQVEELGGLVRNSEVALDPLLSGIAALTDVAETLRSYGKGIDYSPDRLAAVESRLADLERVKRKYGTDLDGLLALRDELAATAANTDDADERFHLLESEIEALRRDYIGIAEKLTSCRRAGAPLLEQRVAEGLTHVAMGKAQFVVSIETSEVGDDETAEEPDAGETFAGTSDSSFFTQYGADRVEFLLSANPGEIPRPLSSVASGGELSRLMLILRTAIQKDAMVDTIVFDEIDVGIGGRVAEAVGERLKSLSVQRQVFCVTHQPQIAKFADQHYLVTKKVERGRTTTGVHELKLEERVDELSRMIGGDGKAEKTREAARWLLENTAKGTRTRSKRSGESG